MQDPSQKQAQVVAYRVRVGHAEVTVRSPSPEEAIRQARRQLCAEMPRLWDVISRMEDRQFRVDLAHALVRPHEATRQAG